MGLSSGTAASLRSGTAAHHKSPRPRQRLSKLYQNCSPGGGNTGRVLCRAASGRRRRTTEGAAARRGAPPLGLPSASAAAPCPTAALFFALDLLLGVPTGIRRCLLRFLGKLPFWREPGLERLHLGDVAGDPLHVPLVPGEGSAPKWILRISASAKKIFFMTHSSCQGIHFQWSGYCHVRAS